MIIANVDEVKLGDQVLPIVYESMEIRRALRVAEVWIPARSGRGKQPLGFRDAEIVLHGRLLADTGEDPLEKLEAIERLFQSVDEHARPHVHRIVNAHCAARGITEVIFEELRSRDDNESDTVRVELRFIEHRPIVVRSEQLAPDPPEQTEAWAGWDDGEAFGFVETPPRGETIPTPAVDDDEVG